MTQTPRKGRIVVIFLLLLYLFAYPINGLSAQSNHVDSLILAIDTQSGNEKLETLRKICPIKKDDVNGLKFLEEYEKESILQNSAEHLMSSQIYLIQYYLITRNNHDSANYYLDKNRVVDLSSKVFSADLFTLGIMKNLIDGKFELALYHIHEVLNSKSFINNSPMRVTSFLTMAQVYYYMHNFQKGFEAIESSKSILENASDIPMESKRVFLYRSYSLQALIAHRIGDFDQVLDVCDRFETSLLDNRYDSELQHGIDYFELMMLMIKANTYSKINETVKARLILDSIKGRVLYDTMLYTIYCEAETEYYFAKGDFKESKKHINRVLESLKRSPSVAEDYLESALLKYKILNKLKEYDEAYDVAREIYAMQEKLILEGSSSQLNEIRAIYENKQMKAQMSAKLERTQIITFALFCIALLSIGLFVLYRRHTKTKERSNKKIYEQYMEMKAYLKELSVQNEVFTKLHTVETSIEDKSESLAQMAEDYLRMSEDFKNKDLTRTELALALGTNRQYLTDAIREKTGKTFRDYLNDIRLEYAHKRLVESPADSVEAIYTEAGFASRNTFNRLFRDKFGMSPNELRQVVKNRIDEMLKDSLRTD